ncbi:MAG: hypothetical protein IKA80_09975 [Spirochaetaceae bacterium]|nr:hypothetical protein [Spirochaetaceae bacterium]
MKKTRIVLVGALVLALAFVMGCGEPDNTQAAEGHVVRDGNKYVHEWKADYSNDTYYRSALQFGKDDLSNKSPKVQNAEVEVELNFPEDGKAGILFAVNNRTEVEGTETKTLYDFFAFAFGVNRSNSSKLEAYVDYYQNATKIKEDGSDAGSKPEAFATGKSFEVKKADLNYAWNKKAVTMTMKIALNNNSTASDATDDYYTLSITDKDGNKVWEGDTREVKNTVANTTGMNVDNYKTTGGIYSYGMLSGAVSDKAANTVWTLKKDTLEPSSVMGGLNFAAEEE